MRSLECVRQSLKHALGLSCAVVIALMLATGVAHATPITIPSGLAPGSIYFLAFVTAGGRDAISSNIADYDAFVSAQASLDSTLAALGTSWKVIGSTSTVNAVDHIAVTGPVYDLQGQLVATGSSDMFDGRIASPISFNQYGNPSPQDTHVWTGSQYSGVAHPHPLGPSSLWSTWGIQGGAEINSWIAISHSPYSVELPFYGISGPLVVPAAVPEPATLLLLGTGLAAVAVRRRFAKQIRPATDQRGRS